MQSTLDSGAFDREPNVFWVIIAIITFVIFGFLFCTSCKPKHKVTGLSQTDLTIKLSNKKISQENFNLLINTNPN